jgi:pimeloyl-ACP methyl ester carboxylesterase
MLLGLSSHPTVLLLAHMGEGKVHQLSIFPL